MNGRSTDGGAGPPSGGGRRHSSVIRPTRRFYGALAWCAGFLAAGFVVDEPVLFTVSGACALAPAVGALELLARSRSTRHSVAFDRDRTTSPGPVKVAWEVAPRRRVRVAIELDSSRGRQGAMLFTGRDAHTGVVEYHHQRRGALRVGPVLEEHADIFGCFTARSVVNVSATTIVWPRLWDIELGPYGGRRSGMLPGRRRGQATDIDRLRPYQRGDDPRRVHWRTSARRGELHVVDRLDDDVPELCVAVDTRCADEMLDAVCSAAASVLVAAFDAKTSTVCVIGNGERFFVGASQAALGRALDALAVADTGDMAVASPAAGTVIVVSAAEHSDDYLNAGADLVVSMGDHLVRAGVGRVACPLSRRFDECWRDHLERCDTAERGRVHTMRGAASP